MTKDEIEDWQDATYLGILKEMSEKRKEDVLTLDNQYLTQKAELGDQHGIEDPYIIYFYSFFNWWKVHWTTTEQAGLKAEGTFEFLKFQEITSDNWDSEWADIYEGIEDAEKEMVGFRPLDMFYESAGSVGFYVNRPDKKGLYLYKGEGESKPLYINFEGYLKLLAVSKGYGWWQNALIEISTGHAQPNVAGFKEEMPKIFPDFNWEEFVALYESLRIDK